MPSWGGSSWRGSLVRYSSSRALLGTSPSLAAVGGNSLAAGSERPSRALLSHEGSGRFSPRWCWRRAPLPATGTREALLQDLHQVERICRHPFRSSFRLQRLLSDLRLQHLLQRRLILVLVTGWFPICRQRL